MKVDEGTTIMWCVWCVWDVCMVASLSHVLECDGVVSGVEVSQYGRYTPGIGSQRYIIVSDISFIPDADKDNDYFLLLTTKCNFFIIDNNIQLFFSFYSTNLFFRPLKTLCCTHSAAPMTAMPVTTQVMG